MNGTVLCVDDDFLWPEACCFSPDGRYLAVGNSRGALATYEALTGHPTGLRMDFAMNQKVAVGISAIAWGGCSWSSDSTDGLAAGFTDGHLFAVTLKCLHGQKNPP